MITARALRAGAAGATGEDPGRVVGHRAGLPGRGLPAQDRRRCAASAGSEPSAPPTGATRPMAAAALTGHGAGGGLMTAADDSGERPVRTGRRRVGPLDGGAVRRGPHGRRPGGRLVRAPAGQRRWPMPPPRWSRGWATTGCCGRPPPPGGADARAERRAAVRALAVAGVASSLVNAGLKGVVGRPRPEHGRPAAAEHRGAAARPRPPAASPAATPWPPSAPPPCSAGPATGSATPSSSAAPA